MTKKKKIVISITSIVLILCIAVIIVLVCLWGGMPLNTKEVGLDKLSKYMGEDVLILDVLPFGDDIESSNSAIKFPYPDYENSDVDEDDSRGFYARVIWDFLTKPSATVESSSIMKNSNMSPVGAFSILSRIAPGPFTNFAFNPFGFNKYANGYEVKAQAKKSDVDMNKSFILGVRTPSAKGDIPESAKVHYYELPNIEQLYSQRITYYFRNSEYKDIEYKHLHVVFQQGENIYQLTFDYYLDMQKLRDDASIVLDSLLK